MHFSDSSFLQDKVAILVLAAGGSSRLGQPKQLVEKNKQPLILYILEKILLSKPHTLHLILGANASAIKKKVTHLPIQIVENQDWASGIGSSIRKGISAIEKDFPNAKAVLILLGDQPFISTAFIEKISNHFHENEVLIVASEYENTFGVPAIFDKKLFKALKNLKGDKGAKSIIKNCFEKTAFLPFPEGKFDIDTAEDLQKWNSI